MKLLKCYTIIGIIFVLITGTFAHFLYGWTKNNPIVGLFTPINESIWEHMKLLFFPALVYSFFIILKFKRIYPCITSSLCLGILTGTLSIPIFYYAYTAILGKNLFLLDIGIFILSVLLTFWISYKLTLSCRLKAYTPLFCCLVSILFICFLLFTYHPPAAQIFEDPAASENTENR